MPRSRRSRVKAACAGFPPSAPAFLVGGHGHWPTALPRRGRHDREQKSLEAQPSRGAITALAGRRLKLKASDPNCAIDCASGKTNAHHITPCCASPSRSVESDSTRSGVAAFQIGERSLTAGECKHIAYSVARWTWKRFSEREYLARQKALAARGGKASGASRKLASAGRATIAQAMHASGSSQSAIAAALNVNQATVSRWLQKAMHEPISGESALGGPLPPPWAYPPGGLPSMALTRRQS